MYSVHIDALEFYMLQTQVCTICYLFAKYAVCECKYICAAAAVAAYISISWLACLPGCPFICIVVDELENTNK